MKRALIIVICILAAITAKPNTYYVATDGNDTRTTTQAQSISTPWATWQKAIDNAAAGDTIYLRGGTWYPTAVYGGSGCAVYIGRQYASHANGTKANPICLFAYPPDWEAGNVPILDCSRCPTQSGFLNGIGIEEIQYWNLKGMTVRNLIQDATGNEYSVGVHVSSGANLTFENVIVHHVGGKGWYADSGAWNAYDGSGAFFASDTTRWINCDAYNLCDSLGTAPGNAGDGWKAHNYEYNLYTWEGCRAWNFSDDGFDPSGSGVRIFNNCWAMSSHIYSGYGGTEGSGFKTAATYVQYTPNLPNQYRAQFYNCISANCIYHGFYNNLEGGEGADFRTSNAIYYNNTVYLSRTGYADVYAGIGNIYKNNIAYDNTNSEYEQVQIYGSWYTESNNTWVNVNDWPGWEYNSDVTVTDADFVSLDYTQLSGARKADGSLPDITFLHLAEGSDLIDAGTDVGLPYNDSNPDMGVFEYGEEAASTATDILTFVLSAQTGDAVINSTNHTVSIEVEYATDVTDLTPTITLSYGATVVPTSGTSEDFTSPVVYTVTAEDEETEQEWTVTVTVAEGEEPPATSSVITTEGKLILHNSIWIKIEN